MSRRSAATCAAIASLAVVSAGCGPTMESTPTRAMWTGALVARAVPKPDVTLTDTAGRPFNIARDTSGRVTLLYFGYTHCPDRCPADMAAITNALKLLSPAERQHVTVTFVTTDPQRDTAAALRAFLDGYDQSFVGLTGSPMDLATAERSSGVTVATTPTVRPQQTGYFVDHAAFMLVYSVDGQAHEAFPGGMAVSREASDLRRLVAGDTPG